MQCMEWTILAAFLGKSQNHSMALPSLIFSLCVMSSCFHIIPPAVRSILVYDRWIYGIFNVCTNLDACRTHEGGGGESGTNTTAKELTRRDRKSVPHLAPPRVGGGGGGRTQVVHYTLFIDHQSDAITFSASAIQRAWR